MKQRARIGKWSVFVLFVGAIWYGLASGQVVARFFYDEQGRVIRQERDTNGDGKMDLWIHYDAQGQIERIEKDQNFDGKPNVFLFYEAEG